MTKSGWPKESYRHSLTRKGIKTRAHMVDGKKITPLVCPGCSGTRFAWIHSDPNVIVCVDCKGTEIDLVRDARKGKVSDPAGHILHKGDVVAMIYGKDDVKVLDTGTVAQLVKRGYDSSMEAKSEVDEGIISEDSPAVAVEFPNGELAVYLSDNVQKGGERA